MSRPKTPQTARNAPQIHQAVRAYNEGRHDVARALCEEALRGSPRDAGLNHLLAAILFAKGDVAGAKTRIEASLGERPDSPPARLLAAKIARAEENFDAALAHLEKATALAENPEFQLERARTLEAAGRRDAARAAWRGILRKNPGSHESAARLGRLLREDRALSEAVTLLERAVAGNGLASVWFDLGLARQDLHDLVGAAAAFGKALEKRPDFAEAAVNLGVVLQDAGYFDQAMAAYRRAYRLRASTIGMIASALTSAPRGRLWLDRDALKQSLAG